MKKFFLLTLCIIFSTISFAQSYSYLTFATAKGEQSMKSEGMVITFSDGKLIAKNAEETVEFDIADLSKFFFSETPTAISVPDASESSEVTVYNVSGQYVGKFRSSDTLETQLPKGIYVVKDKTETRKLIVK
jgi:hypothetical protein